MSNGRCSLHGGKTPAGIASPHFKTGKYSKYLPDRLLALHLETQNDSELIDLSAEIGLVESRIKELLQELSEETRDANVIWRDLGRQIDRRWRFAEAHWKRIVAMQQVITADRLKSLMAQIAAVVKSHVTDRSALAAIGRDVRAIVEPSQQPRQI